MFLTPLVFQKAGPCVGRYPLSKLHKLQLQVVYVAGSNRTLL